MPAAGPSTRKGPVEALPTLHALRRRPEELINELEEEENESPTSAACCTARSTSCARSSSPGSRRPAGGSVLDQVDVDRLTDDPAGKAPPPAEKRRAREPRLLPRVRLPEPGGRELLRPVRRAARRPRTRRRHDDDVHARGDRGGRASELEELGIEGPALVVRSGGGRTGEPFQLEGERTTIGRTPDCDIFLDDVTVSRRHAVLIERGGALVVEDQGSLNGTFLNRSRIEKRRAGERRRGADRQVPADLPRG